MDPNIEEVDLMAGCALEESGSELGGSSAEATPEDAKFDAIVGALEDIIMDDDFHEMQDTFKEAHCDVFEDTEENKLEYTPIFQAYESMVETFLEDRLRAAIDGFSMGEFMAMLMERQDQIAGDVFDVLMACGDFEHFKEEMCFYKAEQGVGDGVAQAADWGFSVTSVPSPP